MSKNSKNVHNTQKWRNWEAPAPFMHCGNFYQKLAKKLFGKAGVVGFKMDNKVEEELTMALLQNVPKCLKKIKWPKRPSAILVIFENPLKF